VNDNNVGKFDAHDQQGTRPAPHGKSTTDRRAFYAACRFIACSFPLKGFIVLHSGDTLKGYIKVFAFHDYYPILDTGTNKVQDIYFSDIGSMRIYNNGPYNNGPQGYTDYVNFGDRHFLWRLDWKKKDVAIYDDMLHMGMHRLIMVTPKARITLYKGRQWFEYYDKIDPLLIRFINERYKTGVSDGNFKSRGEIIDYILDKENSLSSQ